MARKRTIEITIETHEITRIHRGVIVPIQSDPHERYEDLAERASRFEEPEQPDLLLFAESGVERANAPDSASNAGPDDSHVSGITRES